MNMMLTDEGRNFKICLVVAVGKGRVIGRDGKLPWHLPADLKHFRVLTEGHAVVMGRKTWESIGRPLPKRRNIVLSRTLTEVDGIEVAASVEEVLIKCIGCNEVMVIGGVQIYKLFLPYADKMYLTKVDTKVVADNLVRFPRWRRDEWMCIRRWEKSADEKNEFNMVFGEYIRKITVKSS